MLKKITEPQAQYSKAPTAGAKGGNAGASLGNTSPKKKSGFNMKVVGSILAVSLFVVVGIAGVMIAQRQQQEDGPVAPNAPESRPEAADVVQTNSCTLVIDVATTPEGAATCQSKRALNAQGQEIAANTKLERGTVITYEVVAATTATTKGEVVVTDKLPAHLSYVAGSASVQSATFNNSNNTLTVNLGVMDTSEAGTPKKFTYKATLKQDAPLTNFTNAVKVVTGNDQTTADTSCKVTLGVKPPEEPPADGVASCVSKLAYKANNSKYDQNSLVKRGDTITYKIRVRASEETAGPVKVTDTLPNHLSFVTGSSSVTNTQYSSATNTLTFNLGVMATTTQNREVVITYKAQVKEDAPVSSFSNQVAVVTNDNANTRDTSCTNTLQVAPVGVASCESKFAYTDYNGTQLDEGEIVEQGDELVYQVTVVASEQTAGPVAFKDTLPDGLSFVEAQTEGLTHANGVLSATIDSLGTAGNLSKTFSYKVKVDDDAPNATELENNVSVVTNGNTTQDDSCSAIIQTPYSCNSTCETDAQCGTIGSGYICSAEAGNRCRLASNEDSSSCEAPEGEYACNSSCETDAQCQEVNEDYVCADTAQGQRCRLEDNESSTSCSVATTPTPTPAPGCNDACVTNADCSNPDHICYNSNGTQVCRLDTNPTSASCTTPGTPTATTQPELPEELPQSGPEDWVNWLKAGLITLGVGALLLLLL